MKGNERQNLTRRKSSTLHYQTFSTPPPNSRGQPLSLSPQSSTDGAGHHAGPDCDTNHDTPLPKKQMAMLAIIALSEQTALNSISPYLPDMTSTFPEVNPSQVGVYVGTIASAFALAQFCTNFFWGWLSDQIGRKPVILMGTLLTAACFVAFGFCKTLWQAIIVQALMGLVNGNQGVVSTCLGEITDRSNQSKAFTYLPVIYGLGGITGPVVGGLLVSPMNPFDPSKPNPYPYLLPNLVSATILIIDLILTMIFLEESLEEAKDLPPLGTRVHELFSWLWQFTNSSRPSYLRQARQNQHNQVDGLLDDDEDVSDDEDGDSTPDGMPSLFPHHDHEELSRKEILKRDTVLLLLTYLIFQLSNISFNSLYPIFAQAAPPTGRNLNPEEIGLSLAFAGVVTIVFQIGLFGKLRENMGNKTTYRVGLAGFVLSFLMIPWVGYKDGKAPMSFASSKTWLWMELGFVLLVKTVAAVGGLTSALLLVSLTLSSLYLYIPFLTV
jgi:MFS family permease